MRYQPTAAGLAVFILMLVGAAEEFVHSAPRRPSNSASACSLSADKFNQLAAKNPSGAAACRNMADNAQAHGGSFSFMCDSSTGEISCCNDSSCVSLGSAMRGKLPPGIRPEQMPGSLQQSPTPPGGKSGVAPPPGGTMSPQVR